MREPLLESIAIEHVHGKADALERPFRGLYMCVSRWREPEDAAGMPDTRAIGTETIVKGTPLLE